jgi:hypothetical protein
LAQNPPGCGIIVDDENLIHCHFRNLNVYGSF